LNKKDDFLKDKDDEIKDLIEDKHRIETEKNEIKKKLDQEKIQKVLATEFRSTMMKFNHAKTNSMDEDKSVAETSRVENKNKVLND
jgi:hypothetical protein